MNIKDLQQKINKQLNKKALFILASDKRECITEGLSSGSMTLNTALSGTPFIGYMPGKIIEIYGDEGTGKTTLALQAVYEAQRIEKELKVKYPVAYIDMEQALDSRYMESIGIDLNRLSIAQPDSAEEALMELDTCIREGYKLVIVDSVAALVPQAEIDGDVGDSHMGLTARLMGQSLRRLAPLVNRQQAIVLFINQIRVKFGIMFGNPNVSPGGKALKFYAAYRLELHSPRKGAKKIKTLDNIGVERTLEVGKMVTVKVVKNKVFPPFRSADVFINYGKGIDHIDDVIRLLKSINLFDDEGLFIPCKNKKYSAIGIKKILDEPGVQKDIKDILTKLYFKVNNKVRG